MGENNFNIQKIIDDFTILIHKDDELQLVLRGQLYIEAAIQKLIELTLADPTQIDLDRMLFPNKINLAVALGAISKEFTPPLLKLNKIRRGLAHDLNFTISHSDINALFDSFNGIQKKDLEMYLKLFLTKQDNLSVLRACITYLTIKFLVDVDTFNEKQEVKIFENYGSLKQSKEAGTLSRLDK